jgi:hypothetical protein
MELVSCFVHLESWDEGIPVLDSVREAGILR